jgi:hypothetical protein
MTGPRQSLSFAPERAVAIFALVVTALVVTALVVTALVLAWLYELAVCGLLLNLAYEATAGKLRHASASPFP